MRLLYATLVLIAMASTAWADHWKITSRGQSSVWAINSSGCSSGQCAAQPASPAKQEPATVIEAAPQSGTITYGSCSSGNCSAPARRGLFSRWR